MRSLLDDAFMVCASLSHDDLDYLEKRVYVACMIYCIHVFSSSACCVSDPVLITPFVGEGSLKIYFKDHCKCSSKYTKDIAMYSERSACTLIIYVC